MGETLDSKLLCVMFRPLGTTISGIFGSKGARAEFGAWPADMWIGSPEAEITVPYIAPR